MTADLPTHPSTEAVGEVRRQLEEQIAASFAMPSAYIGRWEPEPCNLCGELGKHADDCLVAKALRSAIVEAVTEVDRQWCANIEAAGVEVDKAAAATITQLRAEVERLRARIHEAVDECQRRYGPVESQLAKCRGLMREALRRHDETSGHPPGTHISGYGQAAAAAILEERDQARADLSAMTSDRDWLRGEFEKASASAAGVRKICREWIERYQRNLATAGEYAEAGRLVLHELDGMIWCDTYRCPGHERDDPARSAAPCYPSALTTTKED